MRHNITIKYLQQYIKDKDFKPELKEGYFMKLVEEVGELAEVVRKNRDTEMTAVRLSKARLKKSFMTCCIM
jgi:NTP pyrophosphatase (non-canonical NTP hydrolase)